MADQWEYLMVEVQNEWVTAEKRARWQIRPLTPNGSVAEQTYDAPATLNAYGAQGWELVGTGNNYASAGIGVSYLIFKRRKP